MSSFLGVDTSLPSTSMPRSVSTSFTPPPDYRGIAAEATNTIGEMFGPAENEVTKRFLKQLEDVDARFTGPQANAARNKLHQRFIAEYPGQREDITAIFNSFNTTIEVTPGGNYTLDSSGNVIHFEPNGSDPLTDDMGDIAANAPNAAAAFNALAETSVKNGYTPDPTDVSESVHSFAGSFNGAASDVMAYIEARQIMPPTKHDKLRDTFATKIAGRGYEIAWNFTSPMYLEAVSTGAIEPEQILMAYDAAATDFIQIANEMNASELVVAVRQHFTANREIIKSALENAIDAKTMPVQRAADRAQALMTISQWNNFENIEQLKMLVAAAEAMHAAMQTSNAARLLFGSENPNDRYMAENAQNTSSGIVWAVQELAAALGDAPGQRDAFQFRIEYIRNANDISSTMNSIRHMTRSRVSLRLHGPTIINNLPILVKRMRKLADEGKITENDYNSYIGELKVIVDDYKALENLMGSDTNEVFHELDPGGNHNSSTDESFWSIFEDKNSGIERNND